MLWERAKNLILLFFLALNIILALFLYREQNRFTLSAEQERAIRTVMSNNAISMYKQPPSEFPPMRPLTLSGHFYDINQLLTLFFGSPQKALHVENENMELYEGVEGRLSVSNGYVSFERFTEEASASTIGRAEAIALCEETFITPHYPDYKLDTTANEGVETNPDGSLRLYYRQVFKDYVIYGNFIEFLVTGGGIAQIEMQYGTGLEFTDQSNDICAPDEALLTFIKRIRNTYDTQNPVLITGMDIAYYQEEFSAQENTRLHAQPYYRVFTENNFEPFLINAYTNECIN